MGVLKETHSRSVCSNNNNAESECFTVIVTFDMQGNSLSPYGISDLCGTVAGMITPKGSMSTEGETLPSFCPTLQVLDMSTLQCLSWLLRSRVRKFRRDLWITLCIYIYIYM